MITEEFVTTKLISWLKSNGWEILCFDFPQSGTGFRLKPRCSTSKNKDVIIPDIVAKRKDCGVVFENKDRFFLGDFNKIAKLRASDDYKEALKILFAGNTPTNMYYGISFPNFEYQLTKAEPYLSKIDFLITVTSDGEAIKYYNPQKIGFD